MVMTRQPPVHNRRLRKDSLKEDDEYWNYMSSSSSPTPDTTMSSARRVSSPPRVATAAAAAARKEQEEGLSLYEELLRYYRENPEEEDREKIEAARADLGEDEDKKPAARPSNDGNDDDASRINKASNKGTYRVPVSREYFAAKDREGSPVSPGKHPGQQQQLNMPRLADWDDHLHHLTSADCEHSNSYPSRFPEEMPLPFLDASFHDSAEDEALARQLQAEEEERVAAFRKNAASGSSVPPIASVDADEALARRLLQLETSTSAPVIPAVLAGSETPTHKPRTPKATIAPTSSPGRAPVLDAPEEISKQEKILREIAQENERRQLEWALQESKKAVGEPAHSPPQQRLAMNHSPGITDLPWQAPPSPSTRRSHVSPVRSQQQQQQPQTPEWEARQRAQLEEYHQQQKRNQPHRVTQHRLGPHQTIGHPPSRLPTAERHYETDRSRSSRSSYSSANSREVVLQRGRQETASAIRSGQARIVRCQGCSGRLQAPKQYSLVYCPKCGHVSPVDT